MDIDRTISKIWSFLFKSFEIFIVFFPLPFSPFILPPTSNHHTVVHVHESFFLFAQSLHPSPRHSCQPVLYESVSILLVSSDCSLESTYEGHHTAFVFL